MAIDFVPWQATDISTTPASRTVSAAETGRLDIDIGAQLGDGESADTAVPPTVTIYPLVASGTYHAREDALAGIEAAWEGSDTVRVTLTAGDLEYGRTYEALVLFKVAGVDDRRPAQTFLLVRA